MIDKIWHFAPSNHTTNMGQSGDSSDQFSNYPINNLAREILQNSLDARKGDGQVIVEFHQFTTPASDFPGLDSMLSYIIRLYNQKNESKNSDPKEKAFVSNLVNVLKNASRTNKIRWLRISDFNTSGLWGSSNKTDKDNPWFAFIHGAGKNQKNENSGGSRGQGKSAIFINSLIRTMFVSTYAYNEELRREETASIGVAKLLSLLLDEEDPINPDYTLGVGYCVDDTDDAKKYNSPSDETLKIDCEFRRKDKQYGTDIYIPFFSGEDGWDETIELECIISFLPAIINSDLKIIVSRDDTTIIDEITKGTVNDFLIGKGNNKKEARGVLNVLTSTNTKKIPYVKDGFEMTLWLLQDNLEGQNLIYEYRLPTMMKIRKESIDSNVGYTGVLFIEGKEISKRLRSIEDATHSNWYIGKYRESGYEKNEIVEALNTLNSFIEDECHKFGANSSEESVYFEVGGWDTEQDNSTLSLEDSGEIGLPTDDIIFNMKKDEVRNPRRKSLKRKGNVIDDNGSAENDVLDIGEIGSGDGEYTHPKGHNDGDGGEMHEGSESGNYDPNKGETIVIARRKIATVKAIIPSINPEEGIYDLIFKPEKTGTDAHIEILKVGVDGENEKTKIYYAKINNRDLPVVNNKIVLDKIQKNAEYRIRLQLDENSNYIWEVNIDAED